MLTITIVDQEWFTSKNKTIIYTKVFVEFYNWKNYKQVHKIHRIIEFKKMCILIINNLCNLGVYWIIKIFLVL